MARLEYRLCNETEGFPVLYYYDGIEQTEIAARLACDYFVKGTVTYEKTSGAVEADRYVIYVKKAAIEEESLPQPHNHGGKLRLELRQYIENSNYYPVITTLNMKSNLEVLLYLQSDFVYWLGQEWQKSSTEIDEDRKVYIFYAIPAN